MKKSGRIGNDLVTLNVLATFVKPLSALYIHYMVFYKYRVYKISPIDFWENLCDFLNKKKRSLLMEWSMGRIFDYVKYDHKLECPLKEGNLLINFNNISINEKFPFIPIVPQGKYRLVNLTVPFHMVLPLTIDKRTENEIFCTQQKTNHVYIITNFYFIFIGSNLLSLKGIRVWSLHEHKSFQLYLITVLGNERKKNSRKQLLNLSFGHFLLRTINSITHTFKINFEFFLKDVGNLSSLRIIFRQLTGLWC